MNAKMHSSTKRRRISMSSSASREDESVSVDEYPCDVKRKRVIKLDPIEQCQQLYDIIRNNKKEDGALLCEPFIRVPKRRQEPAYYEVVSNPMDMLRIQQKIKMDEYDEVDQMMSDVDLMITNAKAFYKKSSQEYKDACDLWDLFIESKVRLFDRDTPSEDGDRKGKIILKMGKLVNMLKIARRAAAIETRKPAVGDDGETSESSTTTEKDRQEDLQPDPNLSANLEDLFTAVMLAKDQDDRSLHTEFQLLPSKKLYPNYYDIIENPIDLKMIATKIQAGEYGHIQELEKDLLLMCKNACAYNEPGSIIYKDAKSLKKIVSSKRSEIEQGKHGTSAPGKSSERIRNRRLKSGLSHSAITAALQYEDDEDEEENDDDNEEDEVEDDEMVDEEEQEESDEEGPENDFENPLWILYEAVNNYVSSAGRVLSDPFKKLPSRRYHPNYYKEIKNPISLSQVKNKILRGEYLNYTHLQADINVMFENAKIYNIPESDLYRSAVKLQKVLQSKVQELLDAEEDSSNDEDTNEGKRTNNSTPCPVLTIEGDPGLGHSGSEYSSSSLKSVRKSLTKGKTKEKDALASPSCGSPSSSKSGSKIEKDRDDRLNKQVAFQEQLRKRFRTLLQTVIDYEPPDGRIPSGMFMEKPSKKLYPDYYQVIAEPIDLSTIKNKIETDSYASSEDIMKDFILMFNNCRLYNEESSVIYKDATSLERVLNEKLRELGPDPVPKLKSKRKKNPALLLKQRKLLEIIKESKDDKTGRLISDIFFKLPSRCEYPEYYEIIKSPIDLDRICLKQKNGAYETLESLCTDLNLMLDNACKFNEPDSQIYKDALVLQRLVLQTKLKLEDDDQMPNVPGAVLEILTSIFASLYNHQDEEGRCFTDTMAELPDFDEIEGQKVRGITLDLIKSRLDRGYYKRLDAFQKDMFACFERARTFSRTDSQLFEDSIELQSFFIKTRNEICGNGQVLWSPALGFSQSDLDTSVEALKAEKKSKEAPPEDDVQSIEVKKEELGTENLYTDSITVNDQTYSIGDFVYVAPSPSYNIKHTASCPPGILKPNIANIQKLWTTPDGIRMFEGIWFFRPDQTYHLPTRKFLQKEVFRSDVRSVATVSEIVGKCFVMTVKGKEYFNLAPEGFEDEDIYVCEYRYSSRSRSFTKLKSWSFGSDKIMLLARPRPIQPIRVVSVFSNRSSNRKETEFYDDVEKAPPEDYPNIVLHVMIPGKEDHTFYEQYNLPCGPVRAGDYVYVRVEDAKKLIAKVESMWSDGGGTMHFHGPWFTSLSEVPSTSVPSGRTFYKQEIFQSSIEDTNPLLSICGRCTVLDVADYVRLRPTEVPEDDVYVCESLYDEAQRQIKKFCGLKKAVFRDSRVHQNEIYYFRRPISLVKVDIEGNIVPEMPKLKAATKVDSNSTHSVPKMELDNLNEDSMDGTPSVASTSEGRAGTPSGSTISTPAPTVLRKIKPGKKIVTGYILYSSEVRKSVAERNPNCTFGEISRIVGNDWKNMSTTEKQVFEEKAAKMNEEKASGISSSMEATPDKNKEKQEADLASALAALKKDSDWIFECGWENCEWQFEDPTDLVEHCIPEPNGHIASSCREKNLTGELQCQWRNCGRVKKGANPFPNVTRLLKHVKDIHILKGNGRIIHPEMRNNKHLVPAKNPKFQSRPANPIKVTEAPMQAVLTPVLAPAAPILPTAPVVHQVISRPAPPEPLFVACPPRPQKLLHSEAYIRYIESLHREKRHMMNFETTLRATQDKVPPVAKEKLPTHWLGNGAGTHGSVENALWALRNFMMRDALYLQRITDS